jgi:hypothetical protein
VTTQHWTSQSQPARKRWTPEEDAICLEMTAAGATSVEIGTRLGRPWQGVQTRRRILSGVRYKRVGQPKPQAPISTRVRQLQATIETERSAPRPRAALLRQYRLGLIMLRYRERVPVQRRREWGSRP